MNYLSAFISDLTIYKYTFENRRKCICIEVGSLRWFLHSLRKVVKYKKARHVYSTQIDRYQGTTSSNMPPYRIYAIDVIQLIGNSLIQILR